HAGAEDRSRENPWAGLRSTWAIGRSGANSGFLAGCLHAGIDAGAGRTVRGFVRACAARTRCPFDKSRDYRVAPALPGADTECFARVSALGPCDDFVGSGGKAERDSLFLIRLVGSGQIE